MIKNLSVFNGFLLLDEEVKVRKRMTLNDMCRF